MKLAMQSMGLALVVSLLASSPTSAMGRWAPGTFVMRITMDSTAGGDWDGRLGVHGWFHASGAVTGPATVLGEGQVLEFDGKKGSFWVGVGNIRIVGVSGGVWELEADFSFGGGTGDYAGLTGGGGGTGTFTESGDELTQSWNFQGSVNGAD